MLHICVTVNKASSIQTPWGLYTDTQGQLTLNINCKSTAFCQAFLPCDHWMHFHIISASSHIHSFIRWHCSCRPCKGTANLSGAISYKQHKQTHNERYTIVPINTETNYSKDYIMSHLANPDAQHATKDVISVHHWILWKQTWWEVSKVREGCHWPTVDIMHVCPGTMVVIIISVTLALLVCALIPVIFYGRWRSAKGNLTPEQIQSRMHIHAQTYLGNVGAHTHSHSPNKSPFFIDRSESAWCREMPESSGKWPCDKRKRSRLRRKCYNSVTMSTDVSSPHTLFDTWCSWNVAEWSFQGGL